LIKSLLSKKDIERFLSEDVGRGDLTSESTIPADLHSTGNFLAKQDFTLSCMKEALSIFEYLDPEIKFDCEKDGSHIKTGDTFCTVTGNTRALLIAERPALNLLQRMCGISTLSAKYAAEATGQTKVVDTRKTTPGLRILEKYAVRIGGCYNHRLGLDDGILIKDNHIRAAGGIKKAVERAKEAAHHLVKIEVEVTSLDELKEALNTSCDGVLLDNMDDSTVESAVKLVDGQIFTEVSGGITLSRIKKLSKIGVNYISVGALTHSAGSVDISFELLD
jgi:nicotinate-nucleotide pyrophosphorylase (carboxylating)